MQEDFDKLLKLIEYHDNKIVVELLSHCKLDEITYSTFDKESYDNNKLHILDIYETRWYMEQQRPNNQYVFGYEELMPVLKNTKFNNICISSITSQKGSYILFTDDNKTQFIGILKSKRTLGEVREKYSEHKKIVEKFGQDTVYEYNEIVFINGILQENSNK